MTQKIVIRKMVVDDVYRGFLEVMDVLEPTYLTPAQAHGVYHRRSKRSNAITLVAVCAGKVVGSATLTCWQTYFGLGLSFGRLEEVAVLPGWRGKGVGTTLVRTLVRGASDNGCARVSAEIKPTSRAFFERLGFTKDVRVLRGDL